MTFKVQNKTDEIPAGWRMATIEEGRKMENQIKKEIGSYEIWLFADGKVEGASFGDDFSEGPYVECSPIKDIVIIKDDGCEPNVIDKSCLK